MRHTLRSLRHRNFRLFYAGQLVSLSGTWMQSLAQAWLLYRMTESGLWLGLAGAAALLPNLLFGLYGGVLADRFSRQRLLIAAQALAMVQAFALAALTFSGHIAPWHILLLAFLLGLVQAFELPARHSFVAQLVPRADLSNAIALNSSLFHLARFLGPAIAGVLVAWVGEGWVFFVNGLTFIAVLVGLLAIRLPAEPDGAEAGGLHALREGLWYVWRHATIRAVIALVAAVSLVGSSAIVLMPVFAAKVFERDAQSLGLLLGVIGLGAFAGALTLARRKDLAGIERAIAAAGLVGGAALALFATTKVFALALLILPAVGFCITTMLASSNTLIQLTVPDRLRGRVMALFSVALHGMMPLGQLAVGAAADHVGAPRAVAISGALLFLAAGAFGFIISRRP